MIRLGVNIDHVATLRQARGENYPSPVAAALIAEGAGAANITCHLREDRRHIQDKDVFLLKDCIGVPLNFEMALTEPMLAIALRLKPHSVTLVPEKRQERTTEGGLSRQAIQNTKDACEKLAAAGIKPILFIEASDLDLDLAFKSKAAAVEFHTGELCRQLNSGLSRALSASVVSDFGKICASAQALGLGVHVGHGLNYQNAMWLQNIPSVEEANIGHAIVSRAVFVGFEGAVKEMLACLNDPAFKPRT